MHDNKQAINVVTRALVFHKDHVLVTKWKQGYSFLIGGRVDHGEDLASSLVREVKEETGCSVVNQKLVYFCEHFFTAKEKDYHEYGWYFHVELEEFPCGISDVIPNPDHPDLEIRFVPMENLEEFQFYPSFLIPFLQTDYPTFPDTPRHLVSRQGSNGWQTHLSFN